MERIVIEEKQTRAVCFMLLSLLLLVLSIVIWIAGLKEKSILFCMTGLFSSILFGIGFLIFLGRSLQKKPMLTITFDGIIDSSSVSSVGFIPFQDIDKFCLVTIMDQKVIGVIPKDEEAFINKLSPIKQKIAKSNLNMNYPPFSIQGDKAKDMSLEDIYTLLKKRLDDYSSLYD